MSLNVWYRVTDLDAARDFYVEKLGFEEVYRDDEGRWMRLAARRRRALAAEDRVADEPTGAVFTIDVDGRQGPRPTRLREAGVEVGVVVEIPGDDPPRSTSSTRTATGSSSPQAL